MRARIVVVLAVAAAVVSVAVVGDRPPARPGGPPVAHASLPPRLASYLGVYEAGSPPRFAEIQAFARAAGRKPSLAGYYGGWGQQFESGFAGVLHSHGITPVVQIDPTGADVTAIASGAYDSYLRSYATSVRDFGHAVVIGFGHEMNATWYSWGYHHVPARTFTNGLAAHRDRLPAAGCR